MKRRVSVYQQVKKALNKVSIFDRMTEIPTFTYHFCWDAMRSPESTIELIDAIIKWCDSHGWGIYKVRSPECIIGKGGKMLENARHSLFSVIFIYGIKTTADMPYEFVRCYQMYHYK